jgi:hypothetical protein
MKKVYNASMIGRINSIHIFPVHLNIAIQHFISKINFKRIKLYLMKYFDEISNRYNHVVSLFL